MSQLDKDKREARRRSKANLHLVCVARLETNVLVAVAKREQEHVSVIAPHPVESDRYRLAAPEVPAGGFATPQPPTDPHPDDVPPQGDMITKAVEKIQAGFDGEARAGAELEDSR